MVTDIAADLGQLEEPADSRAIQMTGSDLPVPGSIQTGVRVLQLSQCQEGTECCRSSEEVKGDLSESFRGHEAGTGSITRRS